MSLLRRRIMMAAQEGEVEMKYKTGEFIGDGSVQAIIEHSLGEIPYLFAFIGESDEETSGMLAGIWMNTGFTTNYTSVIQKEWLDFGCRINGKSAAYALSPSSVAYGVISVDEDHITISQYASNQKFISGKTYHWVAIADWR